MMVESAFRNTSLPPHFFICGPCNVLVYNGDTQIRESFRSSWVLPDRGKKPMGGKGQWSVKVYSRKENKTGRRKKYQAQNHNE